MSQVVETQVQNALNPLKKFIARASRTNGSVFYTPRVEQYVDGTITSDVARLRLDYELDDETRETTTEAVGMQEKLQEDLVDLIVDGDTSLTQDPLLKILDGTKKRGVEAPRAVEIIEAVYYHEYKSKKESTEYTLFLLLAVDW